MSFASRPPSFDWEPLVVPELPGCAVWGWFRPADAPDGCLIQIPEEAFLRFGPFLSLRRLMAAAGLNAREAVSWTLNGMTFELMNGAHPLLDQPIPPAASSDNSGILIRTRPPGAAVHPIASPVTAGVGSSAAGAEEAQRLFNAIETDWNSILQSEANMGLARQQLNGLLSRLSSLNRDLSPEEANFSDSLLRREWQDTRRWLREAAGQVSRCLREYDVGSTSSAGNRNRFEQIYRDSVKPRRPIPGIDAIQKEFEVHRKMVQNLLSSMQTAISSAKSDGEQRAQQVLAKIAAKVRTNRNKK